MKLLFAFHLDSMQLTSNIKTTQEYCPQKIPDAICKAKETFSLDQTSFSNWQP